MRKMGREGGVAASGSDGMDCTSRLDEEGDTVAMMEVFVRPPRESCRILVSFDSLCEDSGTVEMRLFFSDNFKFKQTSYNKNKK